MNNTATLSQDSIFGLETLGSSLAKLDPQLDNLLTADAEGDRQTFAELAERISEAWQLLADQMAQIGTPALMDLITIYAENLDLLLAGRANRLSEQDRSLLQRWHRSCNNYLHTPADQNAVAQWVNLLTEPLWQEPLNGEDAAELIDGLIKLASGLAVAHEKTEADTDPISAPTGGDPFIEPLAGRPVEPVNRVLVQMIGDEFAKVADDLTRTLAKFNGSSQAEYLQSLSANDSMLENINKACETVGLFGLSYVFRRLWLNAVAKPQEDHNYDEECNLFGIALILIQQYLTGIDDDKHCTALARHLCEPGWRRPMPMAQQSPLFEALNVTLADPEAQRTGLERIIAKADNLSLMIPADVDTELVQALLHELPQLTEGFTAAIQSIIDADPSTERLLDAQRIAHTLKGACNTIGIQGIANLTHSLEAILEAFNTAQQLPTRELGLVLLEAADCLAAMADCLLGQGPEPEQALSILQQVLDWDYRIKKNGIVCAVIPAAVETIDPTSEIAPETPDDEESLKTQAMMTISSAMLDEVVLAAAESGSLGERVHEKIDGLLNDSDDIRDMSWRLSELVAEMDRLVNIQSVATGNDRNNQGFDALELEQYGELHTCLSRLAEVAADVREQNAQMHRQLLSGKNLLVEQRSMQKEHLESVQNLRLVPMRKIIPRCQRIVRQTARMTGKEVELQIDGENTLIESEILNGLSDALMHLLRNAVDHGIEAPEIRLDNGKPRQGLIRLNFTNDRNALTVICQDDGNGLDTAKIWATAHSKGWVENRHELSDDQIHHLIFRPGFSTKNQASQVSGRGIGMDVIQTRIARMNGIMDLTSSRGQGLTVTMNVPSNLYDTPMILVKINGDDYAVSEHGIQRIFCALDGKLTSTGNGALRYQVDQHSYAADTLSRLLGLERHVQISGAAAGILFKAQNGNEQVVLVDLVIGYKNLMIRPFGDYLKGVYGVLGCVVLGSDRLAPAIDLLELISDTERRKQANSTIESFRFGQRAAKTSALVVDDSLSARKAAVQLLQDAGFEVQTAINGLDALEKIEIRKPDIILSDLEMPRMNGIELTRYLRAATHLQHIPVIMISSRTSEKHRSQADKAGVTVYLTKPFNEDDLIVRLNDLLERPPIKSA